MGEEAITVLAFSESGWARRLRVPKRALVVLAALLIVLILTTVLSVAFAVSARPHLRRLGALDRENRSLTTQLKDQAARLSRLQSEMSSLRELERSVRALSGLPDRVGGNESTGQGEGPAPPLAREVCPGKEVRKCSASPF